jgi:DNA-binding Xre family transcriptional regulator
VKIKLREACRAFKNWSIYRLAKELDVYQNTAYGWATGRVNMSYNTIERICILLSCGIADLIELDGVLQLTTKQNYYKTFNDLDI